MIQLERKIASPQVEEAFFMTKTGLIQLDCQKKDLVWRGASHDHTLNFDNTLRNPIQNRRVIEVAKP